METPPQQATNTHERLIRISAHQEPIIARMTMCSPSDMTVDRCADLTATCCYVARMAHEISLGKTPPRLLRDMIDDTMFKKLRVMGRLSHDPALAYHPAYVRWARTMVMSRDDLETTVTLSIGDMMHWYVIHLRQKAGRWSCAHLEAGCPSRPRIRREPQEPID